MTQPRVSTKGNRLEFLDSARAVAAVAVLLLHGFSAVSPLTQKLMVTWENLGAFGVYTFFFVSGFIIPVSLQRYSIPQFWRSRFFRLVPAYWFSIFLAVALGAAGLYDIDPAFFTRAWGVYLSNLLMIGLFTRKPVANGVFWTLSLELVFYVLCCSLKVAGMLYRRLAVAWSAIALLWLLLLAAGLHLFPPHHLKVQWLGLMMAALVGSVFYDVEREKLPASVLYPLVPAFLVTMCIGMKLESRWALVPVSASGLIVSWIISSVFFCSMFAARRRQFPQVLLWLGRISYSMYLLHGIVLSVQAHLAPHMPQLLRLPVILVATALVADASYRFIERPALALAGGSHRGTQAVPAAPVVPS